MAGLSVFRAALLAGAVCVAAIPIAAHADDDDRGWWPGWGRMMDMWGPGGMMGGAGPDWMLDRVDGRLAYMKTELKITEAQNAAWDAFSAAVRSAAEAHNGLMSGMWDQSEDGKFFEMPLTERLSWQVSHLEARLEQLKALQAATDTFYGVLDEDQKKAADDVVLPMMGMGMGRKGRHMMRW